MDSDGLEMVKAWMCCYTPTRCFRPDAVAESVERRLLEQKVGSSKSDRVKPML